MKSFFGITRVIVSNPKHPCFEKTGTVRRQRRCDNGAWVQMDEDLPPDLRSFPKDDPRGNHIILYPEDCSKALAEVIDFPVNN